MINQIGINTVPGKGYHQNESRMKPSGVPEGKQAVDRVSLTYESVSYSEYNVEGRFSVSADSEYYTLKSIVSSMLSEQGMTVSDALDKQPYIIDEATKEEAAKLVEEEGYWGVKKTSDRIFQFAVNAAGNDTSKIEEIRAALEKGFNMALDSFGGTLPEISYQTYDAVLEKLDDWVGENTDDNDGTENPEESPEESIE